MMPMRTKKPVFVPMKEITKPTKATAFDVGVPPLPEKEWEVRPGGMLVQKRDPDTEAAVGPLPPTICVRVKYGAARHEIQLSSQATFGELKKLLSGQTGLHPQDQKLLFKDKERDSGAYLDMSGVRDRSKIVLVEDPAGQARRCLEMRKNAKMEKAAKSISQISLEVDKLASQVSALESIISKGKKVADNDVLGLIEKLMNQLIKLDCIIADGDVKLQRRIQVRKVQKYVETLDVLKIKNATPQSNNVQMPPQQNQQQQQKQQHQNLYQQRPSQPSAVVTAMNWEMFDLLSALPSTSSATSTTMAASTTTTPPNPRLDWELF